MSPPPRLWTRLLLVNKSPSHHVTSQGRKRTGRSRHEGRHTTARDKGQIAINWPPDHHQITSRSALTVKTNLASGKSYHTRVARSLLMYPACLIQSIALSLLLGVGNPTSDVWRESCQLHTELSLGHFVANSASMSPIVASSPELAFQLSSPSSQAFTLNCSNIRFPRFHVSVLGLRRHLLSSFIITYHHPMERAKAHHLLNLLPKIGVE